MERTPGNTLIIIENEKLTSYSLDDRIRWEIGRAAKENHPDIRLFSPAVSRQQGYFQNMNGLWFYVEQSYKNGNFCNGRKVEKGIGGAIRPLLLCGGSVLIFGAGKTPALTERAVLALYLDWTAQEKWKAVDTEGVSQISYTDEGQTITLKDPGRGTVIQTRAGVLIYMGDVTWTIGDMGIRI